MAFIKAIAIFMAQKANIRLNTRKLYMADGNAVQELLKVASVLYHANANSMDDGDLAERENTLPMDISNKITQLKKCRILASAITDKGATLYDLLEREMRLRDQRSAIIAKPFDIREMERAVAGEIREIQQQTADTRQILESLDADVGNLTSNIAKKHQDLERATKRLGSLKVVRPAYMDEYERIEAEISKHYALYMQKFRNLTYCEHQLDEHARHEQDLKQETDVTMRQMQNRLREEEMRMMRGEIDDDEFVGASVNSLTSRGRPGGACYERGSSYSF